jgi:hypothetical protein
MTYDLVLTFAPSPSGEWLCVKLMEHELCRDKPSEQDTELIEFTEELFAWEADRLY